MELFKVSELLAAGEKRERERERERERPSDRPELVHSNDLYSFRKLGLEA